MVAPAADPANSYKTLDCVGLNKYPGQLEYGDTNIRNGFCRILFTYF